MSHSQFIYFVTITDHAVVHLVRCHGKKTGVCPQTPININLE